MATMNKEYVEGSDGPELEGGDLPDQIGHWMAVLDRWIKQFDTGMGDQDAETGPLDGAANQGGALPPLEGDGRDPAIGSDS
jgi:hypothetical protein